MHLPRAAGGPHHKIARCSKRGYTDVIKPADGGIGVTCAARFRL